RHATLLDHLAKRSERQPRDRCAIDRAAVVHHRDGGHEPVSKESAASRSSASSGGGIYTPSRSTSPSSTAIGRTVEMRSPKPFCFSPLGVPCTTEITVEPMPMKMTISVKRKSAATTICPLLIASRRIVSSERKSTNGGEPVIAKKPARK